MSSPTLPAFPLYVPTKGRSQYMMTSKTLTEMGVSHYLIVEPQQVDEYAQAIRTRNLKATVLPLDLTYKDRYELCDELGLAKSTGPGPARNFAWDHSRASGFEWHWVMDDNIRAFYRLNNNSKHKVVSGALFRAMEDFSLRYQNVAMTGPNYVFFAKQRQKLPPFITNTRIYSCNLIRNDVPFRWRGRYNEDTILSLDLLKAGWCTIQFNSFLQAKVNTQVMTGGNTTEFYHAEDTPKEGHHYAVRGTVSKSHMLIQVHPDVSRVVWKFGRWHHHVDYRPFRNRRLVPRRDIDIPQSPNEYGMVLTEKIKRSGAR
jgi:hypothetical protein